MTLRIAVTGWTGQVVCAMLERVPVGVEVIALREQQKRNFLATLILSQGVPMILHGDEMSRTQGGNNNVYCQDNETSWVHWDESRAEWSLLEFTERLLTLRREHPVFRRRRFFHGRPVRGSIAAALR